MSDESQLQESADVPFLPLSGVRVFELCGNIAGPYVGWILAELGAEVFKIERPEGDDARGWGPPFWHGSSTIFHAINRNKKSLRLDLKDAATAESLQRRIVAEADVVVQNMRPGVVERLGFGAVALRTANPRLIYCNLSAFGTTGPLRDHPGYDALMQAFGGLVSVTGEEGRPPVRAGVSLADMGTGMWSAVGILTALYRRELTGQGGVVDASLLETVLGWMSLHAAGYQASGEVPHGRGLAFGNIVPYQGYRCADGWLIVAVLNDRLFVKLAGAVGHAEWADDDRYRDNPRRVAHGAELNAELERIFASQPRSHWQQELDAAGVPNSPIQAIDEVLAHPQTQALGMMQATGIEGMKLAGLPFSTDGVRAPLRSLAPELGADDES